MKDKLIDSLPEEAKQIIKTHPTINTPEKFIVNAFKSIADLMKRDLDGQEVLIGKDGKYDRYQWK